MLKPSGMKALSRPRTPRFSSCDAGAPSEFGRLTFPQVPVSAGAGIRPNACLGAKIRANACPSHAYDGNQAPIHAFGGNQAPGPRREGPGPGREERRPAAPRTSRRCVHRLALCTLPGVVYTALEVLLGKPAGRRGGEKCAHRRRVYTTQGSAHNGGAPRPRGTKGPAPLRGEGSQGALLAGTGRGGRNTRPGLTRARRPRCRAGSTCPSWR